jgi:hypothetical protein
MKFLKVGRVAIITRGRYAGKKVRNTPIIPGSRWRSKMKGEGPTFGKGHNDRELPTTMKRRLRKGDIQACGAED